MAHPGVKVVLGQSQELLVDHHGELHVSRKLVKLGNHLVDYLPELVPALGVFPAEPLALRPLEHLEVAPARALRRLQNIAVLLHPLDVKELRAEIVPNGFRGQDEDLLVLKLGAQNVLFGDLNGRAGLARAGPVNEQHVASGAVGAHDAAQKELE